MEQAMNFPALFNEGSLLDVPEIKSGIEAVYNCRKLGLHKQLEKARDGVVAAVLKQKGMALISHEDIYTQSSDYVNPKKSTFLDQIFPDGRSVRLGGGDRLGTWEINKLRGFQGAIPHSVLNDLSKLPKNAVDEAWIFSKEVDPIIAYLIKKPVFMDTQMDGRVVAKPYYYAAVWQWE